MLKIYDNKFDKFWLSELNHILLNKEGWKANNVANRTTWPHKTSGTHRLLGMVHFRRADDNFIEYGENKSLNKTLIESFKHILNFSGLNLKLLEICSNLQFKGMNGSPHTDGSSKQIAFILTLCDEDLPKNIGGEFIYKPKNKKISFKHGRLIQFPADSLHAGMSFNKPNHPRISIKYVGEFYD
tara:strand:- start:3223 stop:3774 length:552 start_codon:yes stop_codon:yes gene_type:complete